MGIEKRFDPSPAPNFEVMKIPKEFKLMGETIRVKYVSGLVFDTDNTGEAYFRRNEIRLQKNEDGWRINPEKTEHDFCHEVVHHILFKMSERELTNNEKFVDTFAGLLHQALTTQK